MRLIDADELLKAIANSGMIWETNDCLDVIEVLTVKKIIDDAPTIDSLDLDVHIGGRRCGKRQRLLDELRPKGKWELYQSHITAYDITGFRTWANKYRCSRCGFIHTVIEDFGHYSNCPNCGADMRSVDKGLHERAVSDLSKTVDDLYKKLRGEEHDNRR